MTKVHLHENVEEVNVVGTPSSGQALIWNSSSGKWEPATPTGGSNATQLQGRDIADTAPNNLQYLGWNSSSSKWEPKTLPESSGSTSPEQRAISFYIPGYQYTGAKFPRLYFPFSSGSIQFTRCIGGLYTSPSTVSLIFKVRRVGYAGGSVDVCSVTIGTSSLVGSTDTISQPYWTVGYYLEVYLQQVGSAYGASNLSVTIIGRGIGLPT